jgi:hypothetical protein
MVDRGKGALAILFEEHDVATVVVINRKARKFRIKEGRVQRTPSIF